MRLSSTTISNMATGAMGNGYDTYINTINKIVSNKNFTKISENPTDAIKVLKLDDQLSKLNIYQSNIQAAVNEMDLTYDSLGSITDEMSTISSLVVEASNATTTPESAKAIAVEIKQRVATIQDKLNTKYLGNYIFSGSFTGTVPYKTDETTGDIIYQGSSDTAGARNLTIAENTPFTFNVTGESIIGKQDSGEDFFSQMKELDTLLNTEPLDYNAIRQKLDVLDNSSKNVTQAQGKISAEVSKLEATKDINTTTLTKLSGDKSDLEEIDIVKAASDLANAQTAMQASYLLGTRMLSSVSLLDYI